MFTVDVKFDGAEQIIERHGLNTTVQAFFTDEIMRLSDPYVPDSGNGILKASARKSEDSKGIIYSTPYARYHWYGKLMVDPITGKGAFHDPVSGRFWSRPGVQKVLTDRDMNYQGAPIRGPRWVERAWADNKDKIIQATEEFANGGTK